MSAQVTLPAVGPVSKRALLLGGGTAVIVMGVLWWRKRNAAAPAPTDPATSDPGIDTSGMAGGGGTGGGGGGGSLNGAPANPASNPQWTALVMQDLGGVEDPSALATALGLYLTGGAVTPDQTRIIDEAIAVAGYPPVTGPNGYPPAIHTQPATGQTPAPAPAPTPSPAPAPAPTPASGGWHEVTPWPTQDSTISGLTAHYHPGLAWQTTWSHPNNAPLRALRGQPNLIRARDNVYVP